MRHTTRLLGHELRLVSVEGRGSMFSITVPRAAASMPLRPAETSVRSQDSLGIVIIDDEPMVLEALRQLLEVWGHRVYAGATVEEACRRHAEAAGQGPAGVQMIISDYRLNGMTGLAAIVRVRRYFNRALPAIIVTGDTSAACLVDTEASGFRVLQKPLDSKVLYDALKATLDRP